MTITFSASRLPSLPYFIELLALWSAMIFGKGGTAACCHVLLLLYKMTLDAIGVVPSGNSSGRSVEDLYKFWCLVGIGNVNANPYSL